MFSGKSTELIRRLQRYQVSGRKTLILKWCKDIRDQEENGFLFTHSKIKTQCLRIDSLMKNIKKIIKLDPIVIGIDDGQFFDDIIEFSETMVNAHRKIVVVSALDADHQRRPFGQICNLVAKAESVKKLKSVCMTCDGSASFSKKKNKDESIGKKKNKDKSIIEIGGSDIYETCCRQCYFLKK